MISKEKVRPTQGHRCTCSSANVPPGTTKGAAFWKNARYVSMRTWNASLSRLIWIASAC